MNEILSSKGCNVNIEKKSGTQTPDSSTGFENTKRGIEVLIDWCGFTLPIEGLEGVERVQRLLGIPSDDFCDMPKGANGYKSGVICGNICILYDGKPGMGAHVNMTGQGCRQYEGRFGDEWKALFKRVFDAGGHFSRQDVALDDYRGRITLHQIKDKAMKHEIRTLFGRTNEDGSRRPCLITIEPDFCSAPGVNDGLTVSFGKRGNGVYLRIYDKGVKEGVKYPWLRSELELRDERADEMAKKIVNGDDIELGKLAAGVLKTYVNFIDPSATDTNTARWAISPWWLEFLGGVERIRLTVKPAVKTIDDTKEFLEEQAATSLAMMNIYSEHLKGNNDGSSYYFPNLVRRLVRDGKERLKPRHIAILQAAGVPAISCHQGGE